MMFSTVFSFRPEDTGHLGFRYKRDSPDKNKQVAFVIDKILILPNVKGESADKNCSISMETGDLTLGSVWI